MTVGTEWQFRGFSYRQSLTDRQKRWSLVGLSWGIFAVVVVTALRGSLKTGRLSMPPFYDDVVYLYWSLQSLRGWSDLHILDSLYQLLDQHSPLTNFFGVLGYSFFNGDIGPYIVSTVPLFAFVSILALQLRSLPLAAGIGIVAAVCALPLVPTFITEFRPEPVWSVLVAICVIFYFSVEKLWSSRGWQIACGALTGLAVVSKPTTSPFTVALLGLAFIVAASVSAIENHKLGAKQSLRLLLGVTFTVAVSALCVILPIAAVIGREIFKYVTWVFRDIADQVRYNGDVQQQALYYSFGPAGRQMFGSAMPIFLAIWIFGIFFAVQRCRAILTRVLGLALVLATSYVVPSFSAVKMVWFGSAFYTLLILETAYLLGLLFRATEGTLLPASSKSFLSALIFVLGTALLARSAIGERNNPFGMNAEARAEMTTRTNRIWKILRDREIVRVRAFGSNHISRVMTIAVEPIAGSVITLYGLKESLPIQAVEFSYAKSVAELIKSLPEMDYVVVSPSHEHLLSGAMLGDQLISVMDQNPEFICVSKIPLESGRVANVYERKPVS